MELEELHAEVASLTGALLAMRSLVSITIGCLPDGLVAELATNLQATRKGLKKEAGDDPQEQMATCLQLLEGVQDELDRRIQAAPKH